MYIHILLYSVSYIWLYLYTLHAFTASRTCTVAGMVRCTRAVPSGITCPVYRTARVLSAPIPDGGRRAVPSAWAAAAAPNRARASADGPRPVRQLATRAAGLRSTAPRSPTPGVSGRDGRHTGWHPLRLPDQEHVRSSGEYLQLWEEGRGGVARRTLANKHV